MEERLTELESRIAFQAQTIDALDEEVRLVAKRLEQVERRLSKLADELRDNRQSVGPHDDMPPHY